MTPRTRHVLSALSAAHLQSAPADPKRVHAYGVVLERVLSEVDDEDLAHALDCWLEAEHRWPTPADLRRVAAQVQLARLVLDEGSPDEEAATVLRWIAATGRHRLAELCPPWTITGDRPTDLRLSAAIQSIGGPQEIVRADLAGRITDVERRLAESLRVAASARRAVAIAADREARQPRLGATRTARAIEDRPTPHPEARDASWASVGDVAREWVGRRPGDDPAPGGHPTPAEAPDPGRIEQAPQPAAQESTWRGGP